jgi:tripartite-type tricarboxylate transporter receptor subunit TctC
VRALAVASSTAVPAVPNLPTVTQAGVSGYDVDNWFIYARARRRRSICWPRPRPRC